MLPDVLEHDEVVLQLYKDFAPAAFIAAPVCFVGFALLLEGFAGLAQLVMLVDALDGLFESDGDEQTDDNGGDVDEEVAPGVGGVVWRVDVEHGCWSPVVRVSCRSEGRIVFEVSLDVEAIGE